MKRVYIIIDRYYTFLMQSIIKDNFLRDISLLVSFCLSIQICICQMCIHIKKYIYIF